MLNKNNFLHYLSYLCQTVIVFFQNYSTFSYSWKHLRWNEFA